VEQHEGDGGDVVVCHGRCGAGRAIDVVARYTATLAAHSSSVESVAFAPDGRTLVSGSEDDTAILWDPTDPARPRRLGQPLTGHTMAVESVVFAPDGRTLATGSDDYSTMLWDLTGLNSLRDHALERACAITGGGLNPDEWARYVPGLAYEDACPST
jgi:WD40 repeat protein